MRAVGIVIALLSVWVAPGMVQAQSCTGGQIYTHESFLYGRFEVSMRSVGEDGVVSSFFLYNLDTDCDANTNLNEIDVEMTGNSQQLWFTTHYPGPNSVSSAFLLGFDPHASMHDYAIEWEPDIVRWFVDGQLIYTQDQSHITELIHPMRIMMNLWASSATGWVGTWDPAVMPTFAEYDYVRYYSYTPGTGNTGTNNNFTHQWTDDFGSYDNTRWRISQDAGFTNNLCRFQGPGVKFNTGKMFLHLRETEPLPTTPVTFSVDMREQTLNPGDVVFLNSSFNGWCGTCEPMSDNGGIWSVTLDLEPGAHEYLFTINGWEEIGGAPIGSACDYTPCDQYNNYGIWLEANDPPLVLDAPCWESCEPCNIVGLPELTDGINPNEQPVKIYDVMGRETRLRPGALLFYQYADGRVEKRWIMETGR